MPIREETRKRVLSAAADLGYKPNLLARGLRGSRSSLIGVIARDVSDPFHIQILQGINEVTRAREFRLFLGHVDYRPDVALTYGSMFERSHADGIIVVGDLVDGERTLPTSLPSTATWWCPTGSVPGRSPACTRTATRAHAWRYLWDLGHRRIMCISDPATEDQRLRTSLYEAFMHEHGLGHLAITHPIGQPDPEPSYRLGLELFGSGGRPLPTAVYATSDTIAIGLLRAAYQTGVAVPRQVSVIGFDNIAIAAYTVPPLTTVSQSRRRDGQAGGGAPARHHRGRRGRRPTRRRGARADAVVRDSTAPPAAPG